jgi:aldehyde:ferredoxin oxidoreductase
MVKHMAGGYVGKILFVNLSNGSIETEPLDEQMCRDFVGGYGLGARVLYSRQKAGVDALGPDNTLGFITGPLTGTATPTGARYAVVAKSPLTGGWGDANCGGEFGPYLKFAGCDAVFFTGISPNPVYLLIDGGSVSIKDAAYLWGKDTYETEDALREEYGKQSRVACIGPAAEKLALISCIMTDHGSTAGRSGLGAVMGSKRLKAVVVRGSADVAVADKTALVNLRTEQIKAWRTYGTTTAPMEEMHKYGTSIVTYNAAHNGDTPVKNWAGVGVEDMPDRSGLHHDVFAARVEKSHGCWHCPIACKGILKEGEGEYKYAAGAHRPEYETAAAFGANCLNNNAESISMANDICNRYGLDTISTGTIISFATELYENGIITKADTDGIEIKWGNHQALVAMTLKMAKREGLGDILADGVKIAAEKIGKGAEKYAVHIGGQELGMHDPKITRPHAWPAAGACFVIDATPGRHTSGIGPAGHCVPLLNSAGVCLMGFAFNERLGPILNAVTGWNRPWEDWLKSGERISNIRHVFNLREGINALKWPVHPRILGKPPFSSGPVANAAVNMDAEVYWVLGAMDWDWESTRPSKKKFLELGLNDVANDFYPEKS